MEGLIPMVYRAIKRNKVRRHYRCLSSGTTQPYNIEDFYPDDQSFTYMSYSTERSSSFKPEKNVHRRYNSVGDYDLGFSSMEERSGGDGGGGGSPKDKRLVRFKSHRMLSCLTAV